MDRKKKYIAPMAGVVRIASYLNVNTYDPEDESGKIDMGDGIISASLAEAKQNDIVEDDDYPPEDEYPLWGQHKDN